LKDRSDEFKDKLGRMESQLDALTKVTHELMTQLTALRGQLGSIQTEKSEIVDAE